MSLDEKIYEEFSKKNLIKPSISSAIVSSLAAGISQEITPSDSILLLSSTSTLTQSLISGVTFFGHYFVDNFQRFKDDENKFRYEDFFHEMSSITATSTLTSKSIKAPLYATLNSALLYEGVNDFTSGFVSGMVSITAAFLTSYYTTEKSHEKIGKAKDFVKKTVSKN